MTTNGIGLDKRLPALLAAGLTRVNVSLDTVDREHFTRLTRRDRLPAVLAGIAAAHAAGLPRSRSTPCSCARPSAMPPICSPGRSMPASSCASSSRCRSTPTRPGAREPGRRRRAARRARRPLRARAAARDDPSVAGRGVAGAIGTAPATAPSASSPPSPARSARPATAPGSPRRAPCAPACSATTRRRWRRCCAAAPRRRDRRPLARRDVGQAGRPRDGRGRLPAPVRSMGAIGG